MSTTRPGWADGQWRRWPLLTADLTRSLDARVRSKPVAETVVLDDMEQDAGWVASRVVDLSYTTDRAREGSRSLRFSTLLRNPDYIAASRQDNGTFAGQAVLFDDHPFAASASLRFAEPQDWSRFTRLSFWCYVHPTDTGAIALAVQFLSDGATAGPADAIPIHYFSDLRAGEWNHLTWEFPEMQRSTVSAFTLFQPTFGVTGDDPRITYDIDSLALEVVDAEQVDGWSIRPGTISYSHLGYLPAADKLAQASLGGSEFHVVGGDGEIAATFPVRAVSRGDASWAVLDFSEFTTPGTWRLRYDSAETHDFAVSDDAWLPLIEATLNSFHGMRCGWAVDGLHGVCHADVTTTHDGETRSVAGGWHDAANLTQGPGRTHLSLYALCELADALKLAGRHELADRAFEEAAWGAEWSIGMRFAPGIRVLYDDVSYYTDGTTGTDDDVAQLGRGGAGYDEFQNILAVLADARASRALQDYAPEFSARLRSAAEEDFAVTYASIEAPVLGEPIGINESSWRDRVGYFCLAAVELFRFTGSAQYREAAVDLGARLMQLQETRFVDGIGISGYFYEDAADGRLVHEYHDGFEDSGLLALAALHAEFPDHDQWIRWHAGLVTYVEHFARPGSTASAPFGLLPAALWRLADIDAPHPADPVVDFIAAHASPLFPTPPTWEIVRAQMLEMFDAGVDLGSDFRLRRLPLWNDRVRHGSTTIHLGKSIGVAAAGRARRNSADLSLATRQLEWVVGANPFSRSLVYGVGADWWQNFAVELSNFVGGLSLGFNSYRDDSPAWGNNAVFPYKEQWVYASSRLAMMLSAVGIPSHIHGSAPAGAVLTHERTGERIELAAGEFDRSVPAGNYSAEFGEGSRRITLTESTATVVTLDPERWIALDTTELPSEVNGQIRVLLTVRGRGAHSLGLRLWNVTTDQTIWNLELAGDETKLEIRASVDRIDSPWHMVVIPDDDVTQVLEASGPEGATLG